MPLLLSRLRDRFRFLESSSSRDDSASSLNNSSFVVAEVFDNKTKNTPILSFEEHETGTKQDEATLLVVEDRDPLETLFLPNHDDDYKDDDYLAVEDASFAITPRRVRFREECNEYYADAYPYPKLAQRKQRWYSWAQVKVFRRETRTLIDEMSSGWPCSSANDDDYYHAWTNTLLRIAAGLQVAHSAVEMQQVLASARLPCPYPPTRVGLELAYVDDHMFCDCRALILRHIHEMEQGHKTWTAAENDETKAERIRTMSRAISRPARIFAHAVAVWAAREYQVRSPTPLDKNVFDKDSD